MTANKPEVKQYSPITYDGRSALMQEDDFGGWVRTENYEALQAECDRYRNVIVEVTTRQHAERWTKSTSDTELEQYLSDGIAQLEAECEQLRKDAGLYRALRAMHWLDSPLAVVRNPRDSVRLGSECLSGERLDAAIDAAMETTK